MSTNFAEMLGWRREYDVKSWHPKQRTPNTNDHHIPLNEIPPWKFSAYAADWSARPRFQVILQNQASKSEKQAQYKQ